jgi:hypothetical protein
MASKRNSAPATSTPDEPARIRLACSGCDRSDRDGITEAELDACRAEGWTDIDVVRTYEESLVTYDDPADAPADFDVTGWYTHLGLCPGCRQDDEASQ